VIDKSLEFLSFSTDQIWLFSRFILTKAELNFSLPIYKLNKKKTLHQNKHRHPSQSHYYERPVDSSTDFRAKLSNFQSCTFDFESYSELRHLIIYLNVETN
jgi:hypothetical protein